MKLVARSGFVIGNENPESQLSKLCRRPTGMVDIRRQAKSLYMTHAHRMSFFFFQTCYARNPGRFEYRHKNSQHEA